MKILQAQVKQAEFIRTVWCLTAEHGVTLADVTKPESWAHVAKQFKAGDHIEVVPESGEWFAELFVRSVSPTDIKVSVLREVIFDAPAVAAPLPEGVEFEINYSKSEKWRVVRKSDRVTVASGMASKLECEAWVAEHMSTLV